MNTFRNAQASLRALCRLKLPGELLMPAVLELLHDIVPSYRNLFDWTDDQGQLLYYFVEGPVDAGVARLYFEEFHNRREAECMPAFDTLARSPAGVRGVATLGGQAFYESALYHQIWRPQGLHSRIEGVLRDRCGKLLGSLVLYRREGDRPFNNADEEALSAALPIIAAGMAAGQQPVAQHHQVPSPEPSELVLVLGDGRLCHASAGASRLLLLAGGGLTRDAVSQSLETLAARLLPMLLRQLRDERATERAAAPLTLDSPFGRFVVRLTLLAPLHDRAAATGGETRGAGPFAQLTFSRLEPAPVALERALRALPVTPGQMAVCRLLYEGRRQGEIADALHVAPATVVDHVRKVYRTLDIGSGRELQVLLDRRLTGYAAAA